MKDELAKRGSRLRGTAPERVGLTLGKKPLLLGIFPLITLFLASVYFFTVLTMAPQEVFDIGLDRSFFTFFLWVLVMFYLYVKQLITTFRLGSGNRRAWRDMMRLCLLYTVTSGMSVIMGTGAVSMAFTFETNALILMISMVLLAIYLTGSKVRLYFTPAYAEPVDLKTWLIFIATKDPFKSEKVLLI